ncbi:MAG TPA: hypothetical protein VHE78_01455 [Gemmatimonadaceae bacterium]|nr:hypothetical protein [Gemmatimonadaceae bacterium]
MRSLVSLIVLGVSLLRGASLPAQSDTAALAKSLAGKRAIGWVSAVNSGTDAQVEAFLRANLNPGELADGPPMSERLKRYQAFHDRLSPAAISEVIRSDERKVVLILKTKGDQRVRFTMTLEPESPHGIGQFDLEPLREP